MAPGIMVFKIVILDDNKKGNYDTDHGSGMYVKSNPASLNPGSVFLQVSFKVSKGCNQCGYKRSDHK